MKRTTHPRKGLLCAAALLAVGLAGCGHRDYPERPNILLITIDTLRADHLSSYGYARPTSPVLDRLAAEGVRFDQATVQWPKTGPSFTSIFTSTYSKNNGIVRKVGIPVPLEYRMLAEELTALGYDSQAVVANGAVASDFNFHQGFRTYLETWKMTPSEQLPDPTRADAVTALAESLLDHMDPDKPFFLWVHYLDPHFPYTPPEPYSDRFQGDELWDGEVRIPIDREKPKRDLFSIGYEQVLDGRDELAFYVARYDAEIAFNDAQVGHLLDTMKARGLMENTLTAVTSDHGESLGDHHYFFDHGRFSFQTCLRVPLIFHFPGVYQPAVVKDPVELLGLAPTLIEAAGGRLDEGGFWMQGRSLADRLFGRQPDGEGPIYVFSEAGYGNQGKWQKVLRTRRFKLVDAQDGGAQHWVTGEVGRRYALFDLENDPGETENVAEQNGDEVERLIPILERWNRAEFDVARDAAGEQPAAEMDEATREHLKALGYLN